MKHTRHISAIILASALLAACVKEQDFAPASNESYTGKGFQLTVEGTTQNQDSSKTILGSGYDIRSVYWKNNDVIRVNGAEYHVVTNGTQSEIHFDNNSPSGAIAFYPKGICSVGDPGATSVTVSFPSSYLYVEQDGHQVLDMPLVGKAYAYASGINMMHLCGAVKVDLNNQSSGEYIPDSIVITSTRQLSGSRVVDVTNTYGLNIAPVNAAGRNGRVVMKFGSNYGTEFGGNNGTAIQVPRGGTRSIVVPVLPCDNFTVQVYGGITPKGALGKGTSSLYQRSSVRTVVRAGMMSAPATITVGDTYNSIQPGSNCAFSVSPSKKVFFSKGNLYMDHCYWKFHENQWDRCFSYPTQINEVEWGDYNAYQQYSHQGAFDLFSYGATGDGSPYPWDRCFLSQNIAGTHYDWGQSAYGGHDDFDEGVWRTLTGDEWYYLLNQRQAGVYEFDAWHRFWCTSIKLADNTRVPGILIFPDDIPSSIGWANSIAHAIIGASGEYNYISVDDWNNCLQPAGCVFLPQAGRFGDDNTNVAIYHSAYIYYWTSTLYSDSGNPCVFAFTLGSNSAWPGFAPSNARYPVRLVADAN